MVLIILVGILAYSNTVNSPFFFDDTANIVNNPLIQNLSFSGLKDAFHSRRAIGILSFQLNYLCAGLNVVGYHLTNIAIHIASSLAVYILLQLILATEYMTARVDDRFRRLPLPFFAALLFVAHPVQTQAVTYIVQRFASLAAFFYFVAVIFYLKARINQVGTCNVLNFNSAAWYAASLLFGFLAVFTKETAYTLPLAIVLVELLFFSCNLRKIAGLMAGGTALLIAIFFKLLQSTGSFSNVVSAIDAVTRVQSGSVISRSDYLLTQFRVIVRYLSLIVLPANQRVEYDYPLYRSFFDLNVFCSFILIVLLFTVAIWMVIKSRNSFPQLRLISFGIFWFFLGLSIESSFIPIIDLIFEHRLYLPSFGAFTAITTAVLIFASGDSAISERKLFIGFLLMTLLLATATWRRNSLWSNEVTLWADNVRKSPASARAWHHLGAAHIRNREPLNALVATVKSIELDRSRAATWNNLGVALDLFGVYNDRFNRTYEMFSDPRSVTEKNMNNWQGEVNNNFGLAYEIIGNLKLAAENYSNAVGYNPSSGLAYYNLGIVSARMNDGPKYSEQLQILQMINPVLAERLQQRVEKR